MDPKTAETIAKTTKKVFEPVTEQLERAGKEFKDAVTHQALIDATLAPYIAQLNALTTGPFLEMMEALKGLLESPAIAKLGKDGIDLINRAFTGTANILLYLTPALDQLATKLSAITTEMGPVLDNMTKFITKLQEAGILPTFTYYSSGQGWFNEHPGGGQRPPGEGLGPRPPGT